jgi:hypothetical protein
MEYCEKITETGTFRRYSLRISGVVLSVVLVVQMVCELPILDLSRTKSSNMEETENRVLGKENMLGTGIPVTGINNLMPEEITGLRMPGKSLKESVNQFSRQLIRPLSISDGMDGISSGLQSISDLQLNIAYSEINSNSSIGDGNNTADSPAEPIMPGGPGNTPHIPIKPDTPLVPETPEVPITPDKPETPEVPITPDKPDTPEVPITPDEPDTPEVPVTPEKPDTPEVPVTPEKPDTPEVPVTPVGFTINGDGMVSTYNPEAGLVDLDGGLSLPSEGCTGLLSCVFAGLGTGIGSIRIPSNITFIEDGAFRDLTELWAFETSPDHPTYANYENILYDSSLSTIIAFPAGRVGHYKVPGSVTSLGEYAFANSGLSTLDMRGCGIVEIAPTTFEGCNLKVLAPREYLEDYLAIFSETSITVM